MVVAPRGIGQVGKVNEGNAVAFAEYPLCLLWRRLHKAHIVVIDKGWYGVRRVIVEESRLALPLVVPHAVQGYCGNGPLNFRSMIVNIVLGAMTLHVDEKANCTFGTGDAPAGDEGRYNATHFYHQRRTGGAVGSRFGSRRGVGYKVNDLLGLVSAGDVRQQVLGFSLERLGLDIGPNVDGALTCQGRQALRCRVVDRHRPGTR